MANNRDRFHGDTVSRRGGAQFSATRIMRDLSGQTPGTPEPKLESDSVDIEGSAEPIASNYWLGRKVLNSQLLTKDLIGISGLHSVVATDGLMLTLPLTRRHAFSHLTRAELEELNDSVVSRMPQARENVSIQVTGLPSYNNRNRATLAATLGIRSEGFINFRRMCEAVEATLRPQPGRKKVPPTLRIVERTRRGDIGTIRARVARSGLFIKEVNLGPVEVCSSPAE